jgi:hypothetical protein
MAVTGIRQAACDGRGGQDGSTSGFGGASQTERWLVVGMPMGGQTPNTPATHEHCYCSSQGVGAARPQGSNPEAGEIILH